MGTKAHYDNLLGRIYSWLAGDVQQASEHFAKWLEKAGLPPGEGRVALDLGAGHGAQSAALAKKGYRVRAIDFSDELLRELEQNTTGLGVEAIRGDLRNFHVHRDPAPSVILCWGDTLTHLESRREADDLIGRAADMLSAGGFLLLSFRDYSSELKNESRFIPVKSDEHRVMCCMLEFFPLYVKVSDIVHEREGSVWKMQVSSYLKLRLDPDDVLEMLEEQGFTVVLNEIERGMVMIAAQKKN